MKTSGPGANMRLSDIVIDDATLSMAAKGVFVTVGLLGDGCAVTALENRSKDGASAVARALKELITAGYVTLNEGKVFFKGPGDFGMTS